MSTIFWKALKFSSALLGAALLFSGSAYARESSLDQKVATSTEATVAASTELTQTQAVASNSAMTQSDSEPTAATSTNPLAAHKESAVAALTEPPQNSVSQLTDSDASATVNRADNTLAQQVPTVDNGTSNTSDVLEQVQEYQDGGQEYQDSGNDATTLDQVTNVTQLSDVRPTDWAYEALRSLVERYGCIAGYPDGTYRGNRAMSRYEFAAGLNACLQQVAEVVRHGFTGLWKCFHGQEHERGEAVGNEYPQCQRQPAGNGAAHGLPCDIPRHGGAGQVFLYEAALNIVNEGRGIRQRGEYGQSERHGVGRQRAHDKVAVEAARKQPIRAKSRQYALNGGKERNERRAREGEQKAPRAHRLPEI